MRRLSTSRLERIKFKLDEDPPHVALRGVPEHLQDAYVPRRCRSQQCSGKALADVSAVADPATGVSVYDTTPYQGSSGWLVFGGTSASAPIIGAVYALGGNLSGYPASYTWSHSSGLFDATSGSNGSCSPSVWCTAGPGWDGPTGLGTPNGTTAF